MSWCDMLASTPTAGFLLDPYVASGDRLLDALHPVLQQFTEGSKSTFAMEQHDSTSILFNTDAGFRYGVDTTKVHVRFNHRLRATPVSGGPPRLEMLTHPQPYSDLLPEVLERLVAMTVLLPGQAERKVRRVGIVTETNVAEDELPPGIARMIEHVIAPWGSAAGYTFRINAPVADGDGWTDACIHTITRPDDPEGLMTLNFDWGRTFDDGRVISKSSLSTLTSHCKEAALSYFECLGEGVMFDERLSS